MVPVRPALGAARNGAQRNLMEREAEIVEMPSQRKRP